MTLQRTEPVSDPEPLSCPSMHLTNSGYCRPGGLPRPQRRKEEEKEEEEEVEEVEEEEEEEEEEVEKEVEKEEVEEEVEEEERGTVEPSKAVYLFT
ncbi:hypothetical protein GBF38_021079, partial [Nibea albiflora]